MGLSSSQQDVSTAGAPRVTPACPPPPPPPPLPPPQRITDPKPLQVSKPCGPPAVHAAALLCPRHRPARWAGGRQSSALFAPIRYCRTPKSRSTRRRFSATCCGRRRQSYRYGGNAALFFCGAAAEEPSVLPRCCPEFPALAARRDPRTLQPVVPPTCSAPFPRGRRDGAYGFGAGVSKSPSLLSAQRFYEAYSRNPATAVEEQIEGARRRVSQLQLKILQETGGSMVSEISGVTPGSGVLPSSQLPPSLAGAWGDPPEVVGTAVEASLVSKTCCGGSCCGWPIPGPVPGCPHVPGNIPPVQHISSCCRIRGGCAATPAWLVSG